MMPVVFIGVNAIGSKENNTGTDYLRSYYLQLFLRLLISQGILSLVLIAELIVYWHLRDKDIKRQFAWAHILLLFVSMVILPLIPALYIWWATYKQVGVGGLASSKQIRQGFEWGLFILAHLFFIMMLIDRKKRHKAEKEVTALDKEQEGPDMLDDYAGT